MTAPDDHWNTPVLVDDVAEATAAVVRGHAPQILRLGGPERIARTQRAALMAKELGVSPDLVVSTLRAQGRYAYQLANACLSSTLLARTPLPGTSGYTESWRAPACCMARQGTKGTAI